MTKDIQKSLAIWASIIVILSGGVGVIANLTGVNAIKETLVEIKQEAKITRTKIESIEQSTIRNDERIKIIYEGIKINLYGGSDSYYSSNYSNRVRN